MLGPRRLVLAPLLGLLLLATGLPAQSAQSPQGAQRALPEQVTIKDGRSSAAGVDIAQVRIEASWYWDSEQSLRVTTSHGFRPGQRLTVWFDIDGDSVPDGHHEVRLGKVVNQKRKTLAKKQEFRLGGDWSHGGTTVPCTNSSDVQPLFGEVRKGQRTVELSLDLWSCLDTPNPGELDSGAWRVAVALAKGGDVDMAPNHRRWSAPVAGWGPCDPSGGDC